MSAFRTERPNTTAKFHWQEQLERIDKTANRMNLLGRAALGVGALLAVGAVGLAIIHFTAVPLFASTGLLLAVAIPVLCGGVIVAIVGHFCVRHAFTFPEKKRNILRDEVLAWAETIKETPGFNFKNIIVSYGWDIFKTLERLKDNETIQEIFLSYVSSPGFSFTGNVNEYITEGIECDLFSESLKTIAIELMSNYKIHPSISSSSDSTEYENGIDQKWQGFIKTTYIDEAIPENAEKRFVDYISDQQFQFYDNIAFVTKYRTWLPESHETIFTYFTNQFQGKNISEQEHREGTSNDNVVYLSPNQQQMINTCWRNKKLEITTAPSSVPQFMHEQYFTTSDQLPTLSLFPSHYEEPSAAAQPPPTETEPATFYRRL
ncbi:MAG: hypothetical protein KR126chlam2_00532 [Chlamydiae bacterium]|nr:hypothetical protein [Chlamydiota bacterium]